MDWIKVRYSFKTVETTFYYLNYYYKLLEAQNKEVQHTILFDGFDFTIEFKIRDGDRRKGLPKGS
jgi:hypothetical protein